MGRWGFKSFCDFFKNVFLGVFAPQSFHLRCCLIFTYPDLNYKSGRIFPKDHHSIEEASRIFSSISLQQVRLQSVGAMSVWPPDGDIILSIRIYLHSQLAKVSSKFCQILCKMSKKSSHFKFWQGGEITPNLVTLIVAVLLSLKRLDHVFVNANSKTIFS